MTAEFLFLVLPVACFALEVLAQLVSHRLTAIGLLRSEFLGFAAGLAALAAGGGAIALAGPLTAGDAAGYLATDLAIYGSLGYCYFHFINLGVTARRIRLLRELDAAPGGLTRGEILARYDAAAMVEIRLGRLLGSGQVALRDGRFHARRGQVAAISRIYAFLRWLLLGSRARPEIRL